MWDLLAFCVEGMVVGGDLEPTRRSSAASLSA